MTNSTTRRHFIKVLSLLSLAPSVLYGNSFLLKPSMPRIGFITGAGVLGMDKIFRAEMEKLGYTEGKNIHIEWRLPRPNTNEGATMAAELATMDLLLVVVAALPFALEVRKANPDMPMVIGTCPGLVSNGFAKTLQHPGGIYTGLDELPEGVTAKRLQLLKAAAPSVSRVGLLSTTPGVGGHELQLADAQKAAATLGLEVKVYRATSLAEIQKALDELAKDGMNGLLNFQGGLSLANRQLIVDVAAAHHIPAMYQATAFAEAGGMMAWAPDLPQQFREAARYVDKILKGAKPGDLPAKHPEKYYLTLNKTAASKVGVSFSKELLAEAAKVIE
jgi:putative tryptophan/tyrosine transport system substrate-binding protein